MNSIGKRHMVHFGSIIAILMKKVKNQKRILLNLINETPRIFMRNVNRIILSLIFSQTFVKTKK